VLKQLLILEFIVQIVEGTFYVWLAFAFHKIKNVTPYRYYDWYITTPTMLITFSVYLIYLKNKEELKDKNTNELDSSDHEILDDEDFFTIIKKNAKIITYVLILNAAMLTFGLLNEHHVLNKYLAVFLGFIPFIAMFYLIYENYAKYTEKGIVLFKYFSFVWSLYGVAALMSYHWKNIFYNILDLFAKNFFGLYLAYVLYFSVD
jgi:magnesium-transporting ATPase (P-type)